MSCHTDWKEPLLRIGAIIRAITDINLIRISIVGPAVSFSGSPTVSPVIDALFSPVTKVNYEVENTRVGQDLNYDRLVMEIWTDGSISPQDALIESAKILRKSLTIFTGEAASDEEETVVVEDKTKKEDKTEEIKPGCVIRVID